MPVVRRPIRIPKTKPEPTPALAIVVPVPADIAPAFISAKDVEKQLLVSHHEVRRMVNERVLVPIPYLGGRVKPWRFSVTQVNEIAKRQIALALAS